jgi:hypothetical protein
MFSTKKNKDLLLQKPLKPNLLQLLSCSKLFINSNELNTTDRKIVGKEKYI